VSEVRDFLTLHPEFLNTYIRGKDSLLHWAAHTDRTDMLELLLDLGMDINTEHGTDVRPPVDVAIGFQNYVSAEWLIRRGAQLRFVKRGITFSSSLGLYTSGRFDLVKLMVDTGLSLNDPINDPPTTELDLATLFGTPEMGEYLRSKGAKTAEELGLVPPKTRPANNKKSSDRKKRS
jgi:ankyrin repeat protein